MTILEHIDSEMKRIYKLEGSELEREYIQLQQAVNDRLERLMKEKGLMKVTHSHDKITGVINLDDAKW